MSLIAQKTYFLPYTPTMEFLYFLPAKEVLVAAAVEAAAAAAVEVEVEVEVEVAVEAQR